MHICNNNKNITEQVGVVPPNESVLQNTIADIQCFLQQYGFHLSDSFCFGLGSGLSIRYLRPLDQPRSVVLQSYSSDIEKRLLTNLTQPLYSEWLQFKYGKGSHSPLRDIIDMNVTPEMIRNSILDNALSLKKLSRSKGIEALHTWVDDLPNWKKHKEWRTLLHSIHLSILYNGEGGGLRQFYVSFLSEASTLLPEIEIIGLPKLMKNCALEWDNVAHILENGSKAKSFPFSKLKTALLTTYLAEKKYVERVFLLAEENEKVARFYNSTQDTKL